MTAFVAFSDHVRSAAEEVAELADLNMDSYHADYDDLLRREDVEAVLVSLPIHLNYPVTKACLEAGKHVICEKPAGSTLDQARDFAALPGQFPHLKVLIAENHFYRDDLRLARSLLDDGAIGPLHLMTMRAVGQMVPQPGDFASTTWRQTPHYRGGPQLDGGVHQIAQIRLLCGDAQSVHALAYYANPAFGGPSDLILNLHFVSEAIGSYVCANLPIPVPTDGNDMHLYGRDGVMVVGTGRLKLQRADGSVEEHLVKSADPRGYFNEFLNFYEALTYDEPIVSTIAQNYHNVLIVMRALDSAEEGRVVDIDAPPEGLSATSVPLWKPRRARDLFDQLPTTSRRRLLPAA